MDIAVHDGQAPCTCDSSHQTGNPRSIPNPIKSVYGLRLPHLVFISKPDENKVPISEPDLALALIVRILAAVLPPRAKRIIAKECIDNLRIIIES